MYIAGPGAAPAVVLRPASQAQGPEFDPCTQTTRTKPTKQRMYIAAPGAQSWIEAMEHTGMSKATSLP